jgi:hypothetical protein
MIRDGIPFSIRSMVKGEIPARLANSILLHILASRSFLRLFLFSMGMHLRLEGHGSPCFLWNTLLVRAGLPIGGQMLAGYRLADLLRRVLSN